ncbi:hypothetical protein L3Q65_46165 [Amycolatopsis sp. FU40]|uniref:hypothetical protein n=1 Tax=Amycolatopsis sp. FU40 TaxID=2914159 RepID=UPI001F3D9819|nr:hypothetical protein [Amycolatopsis sp. FU40]UKD55161.1 hypothetical protein L3Q65_46165 [Amycolatopsis sp. FU40]
MAWARGARAREAWAARGSGSSVPPGQQSAPPPIPGGTPTWIYTPNRTLARGMRGWAGRLSPISYPGGGISIRPVPDRGVMEVTAWWPDADFLSLVRLRMDGTLEPVRGGSPITVAGVTRRNYCQNPSFEAGLNGVLADLGTPTLAQVTDGTATQGKSYLRATIASAGSCGVVVPNALPPGIDLTIAFDVRLSAVASGFTVQAQWVDSGGLPLTTSTASLSSNDINRSVGQFARQVVRLTTPAAGVSATIKLVAAGLPASGSVSLDGITIERRVTDGSYFDGATYGATWLGVPDLSSAALAPLCVIQDGECPVDEPVRYVLVNPSRKGGSMTSGGATLESLGRVWLTHPKTPSAPMEIFCSKRPLRGKKAGRTVFQAIDDPLAITVSQRRRSGWVSTEDIQMWTFDEQSTAALWAFLDDNWPLFLRAPADHNWGPGVWLSLDDANEDPDGAADWQKYLKISASWVQVAAPAV